MTTARIRFFCITWMPLLLLPSAVTQSYDDAEAVYSIIKNASTTLRPVRNQSHILEVSVIFNLMAITQVDEVRQELSCNGWINLSWTDQLRTWDPDNYGGIQLVHTAPTDIWRSRVMVSNSLQDRDIFKDAHAPITVLADGSVRWYPGGIFHTSCKMAMTVFPFDKHRCSIRFLSNNYYDSEVVFMPAMDKINSVVFSENGEWDLVESSVQSITIPVNQVEVFPGFSVTLTLTRRPGFFLLNVVLPIMLLSLLNFMVFVLPDRCGEKVTFGTTILLSQAVYMSVVTDLLPQNSDSIPLVLVYLFCVLVLCSVAVGVSIVVVAVDSKQEQKSDCSDCANEKVQAKQGVQVFSKQRVFPLDEQREENEEKPGLEKDTRRDAHIGLKILGCCCKGPGLCVLFVGLWLLLSLIFLIYGLQWEDPDN